MEQDTILKQIQNLKSQAIKPELHENMQSLSFHEYDYHTVSQAFPKYLQSLRICHESNPSKSKILKKLLTEHQSYTNSILSFGGEASSFLNQSLQQNQGCENLLIYQTHYHSQSVLLAFYLKRQGHNVRILSSRNQLQRGWINCLVSKTEPDKISEFISLLKDEGIGLTLFENNEKMVDVATEKELITIIDIFNIHPTKYRPFLFKQIKEEHRIIMYCSAIQQEQVSSMIEKLPTPLPFEVLEFSQNYPIEIIEKKRIEDQLLAFLQEESSNPNKQDIVIFQSTTTNFIHHFNQILKKEKSQYGKHINFLTGPNQSQKFGAIQGSGDAKVTSSLFKSNISTNSTNQPFVPPQIYQYNNIFVAPNYQTLISWNYDLTRVFYVIDFQKDETFNYDYNNMCFTESVCNCITLRQYLQRLSLIGVNRIGRYCSSMENHISDHNSQLWYLQDKKAIDLGVYCLEMIRQKINHTYFKQQMKNSNIANCLSALQYAKIIEKDGQAYKIIRNDVLEILQSFEDINPIILSTIIDYKNYLYQSDKSEEDKQKYKKMAQLLAISASVLMTPNNLRQIAQSTKNNNILDRPTPIWRQTGYLHSAIDAIVRYRIIQNRNNAMRLHPNSSIRVSKERLSKFNSNQFDVWGNLFEIIQPNRITFDEMKEQDFIREEFINEPILHKVIDTYEKVCEVLELEEVNFNRFQQINQVIQALLNKTDRGYGVYSGSRKQGYYIQNNSIGIFPNKISLLSLLNERPSYIYITRLSQTINKDGSSKLEIQMCNHLGAQKFMEIFGTLPTHNKSSCGEHQLQFHGISSATFTMLNKNNGADIQKFQNKYSCLVEFNEQIAMILIYCSKENSKTIQSEFQSILEKIKNDLIASTKIMNYFGNTSIVLGSGGALTQVIKDTFINKCELDNLNIHVEQQDLYELFEEFFTIKNITINEPDNSKKQAFYKSAIIQFVSQKDYYRFHQFYNECLYMDRYLRVNPIQSKPEKTVLSDEMYIQFNWYVWKSQSRAMVEFQSEQIAKKCEETMKQKKIDKVIAKISVKQNKVYFDDLNQNTDQIILESAIKGFGKIVNIQILKTPLKQTSHQEDILISEIRQICGDNVQFEIKPIKKLKNGLRRCNVIFYDIQHINGVLASINRKMGIIGVGRIHAISWFTKPVIIAKGYLSLYEELINGALSKMPENHCITLEHQIFMQNEYIVTKSTKKDEIEGFRQKVNNALTGFPIEMTGLQANILMTEIGIQNLLELQQKYNCKLLPDFNKKTLLVLTKTQYLQRIKEQIKARANQNFFYRIPLNLRAFKHFKENPDAYTCMKNQYHLTLLELEEVGRNILIEGNAHHVQQAFNYLMHIIQSISKSTEQMVNADCCGICCEEPFRPYRLQQCGHRFCMQCLIQNTESTLGDISMFPIKCPQCLAELVMDDLNSILDNNTWPKLISMAVNQYIGKNPQIVTNCFTAGCKQINFIIKDYFKCDSCSQSYCLQCKMNIHPGLTCQQAKKGGDAAFQKYMQQNNVRRCPYEKCKMPIQRIDGCYRVTCNRCGKSMCFKCEPQQMIAYDNYNDCYKHLSEVHGGYF